MIVILSMEKMLDGSFWNNRYETNTIGWDLGAISSPLKEYFDQLNDKSIQILIPGAGNAYEAEYLVNNGFTNVSIIDIASKPLENFQMRNPNFPSERLLLEDFFNLKGQFDLIVEQTFFCALDPSLRTNYAIKMNELLVKGGKVIGVLFNREFTGGPPFGGGNEEYELYFKPVFTEVKLSPCYNSIEPRKGSELFIQLIK